MSLEYYNNDEITNEVQSYLLKIIELQNFKDGIGLIGGWAVFYLVNDWYSKTYGRAYQKSLDIDIVVDKDDIEDLVKILKNIGFPKWDEVHRGFCGKTICYDERVGKQVIVADKDLKEYHKRRMPLYVDVFSPDPYNLPKPLEFYEVLWLKEIENFFEESREYKILGKTVFLPNASCLFKTKYRKVENEIENTFGNVKSTKDVLDLLVICFAYPNEIEREEKEKLVNIMKIHKEALEGHIFPSFSIDFDEAISLL